MDTAYWDEGTGELWFYSDGRRYFVKHGRRHTCQQALAWAKKNRSVLVTVKVNPS